MSDTVISVENLSKRYLVGHHSAKRERYTALRDVIARETQNFARKTIDLIRGRQIVQGDEIEEFWALKDVSFEVKQGQVLGIVGRNGAGKSTLLKILSRITEPTQGRAILRGRVVSLLEVGTGFHPELTGRENIFLNGAILGMRRAEIGRKFEEIVAFAEVERFLDTPVKRYSSGMYVRLAFAVAAHLDPEILVVDEVLAVGDVEFQRKCLGKMQDVASKQGRTVLFVSHSMNTIERLCVGVIYLDRGRIAGIYDDVREGILAYQQGVGPVEQSNIWRRTRKASRNDYFVPEEMVVCNFGFNTLQGEPLSNSRPIEILIAGMIQQSDPALNIGVAVYGVNDELLFWSFTSDDQESRWPVLNVGSVKLRMIVPRRLLNEGNYRVEMLASLHHREWLLEPRTDVPSVVFSVQGGLSDSPYWDHARPGLLAPVLHWEHFM